MSRHSVSVWGRSYQVDVDQLSKAVFRAVGDYQGEWIEKKDALKATLSRNGIMLQNIREIISMTEQGE